MPTASRPSCSAAISRDGSGTASTNGASGAAKADVTGAPLGPPHAGHADMRGVPRRYCPKSAARLLDEAVRVARGIPTLKARLVHAQTVDVVAVREEARVDAHAASLGVRV